GADSCAAGGLIGLTVGNEVVDIRNPRRVQLSWIRIVRLKHCERGIVVGRSASREALDKWFSGCGCHPIATNLLSTRAERDQLDAHVADIVILLQQLDRCR